MFDGIKYNVRSSKARYFSGFINISDLLQLVSPVLRRSGAVRT